MPPSSLSDDFDRLHPDSSDSDRSRHRHHHHHHHHSRHRHHLSRYFDKAFALAACLLLGWVLIPLASVGFFETRLVAIGIWLLVALSCLVPRGGGPLPCKRLWGFLAAALTLWCGFQLIPFPAGSIPFWRGDSIVFARIAAHVSGRLAIAVVPYEAFHTALHWAGLFALACTAAHRLRTQSAARLLLAGCIIWALLESAFSLVVNIGPSVRLRGTFANPDAFGGFLAMTLPLTAALLLDRFATAPPSGAWSRRNAAGRTAWILVWATAFLVQLVILFFTGSRGATASAAIVLAILLVWCWQAFPAHRKAILGGILLLACLAPLFFIRAQRLNVWDRAIAAEGSIDTGITQRKHIWEAGLALVHHFPFGTGPGGSVHAMPLCQSDFLGRYRLDYAHNDTLQFLGDLGWPGGILLFCGLLLLARRAIRTVRAPAASDSPKPWLERGAALALLAALVHSQAEFNLSARPPIQMMFALLAGFLFAAPDDSSRSRRPAWLLRAPVLLAAAVAIVLSFRAATAYRSARAAAQATGFVTPPTDSPLLLPHALTLPVPSDNPAIARAARWGANSPFVHEVLSSLPLANHRHAVLLTARAQAEAIRARENDGGGNDEDEEYGTSLTEASPARDYTDPTEDEDSDAPSPEIIAQITLALRPEEAQAVRDALPDATAALRLAPWSSRAMTDRAWLLLRASALRAIPADDIPSAVAEAHADLDLAATLYPSDAYTLSDICAALSAEEKTSENLPRILELAERAFSLNPTAALDSMDRWWHVGIPIQPFLDIEGLPLAALQKLYRRAIASGDTAEADDILSRIEFRTRPETPPPPVAKYWDPARLADWKTRLARTRIWSVRQRLRADLRAGDWAAVATSAPARAEARNLRFEILFNAFSSSPVLRRLRLRDWNERGILPRHWRIEWALAECAAGKNPELYRDIWAEASRHLPLPPDQAARIPAQARAEFPALTNPSAESARVPTDVSLELPFLGERIFLESVVLETPVALGALPRLLVTLRFDAPPLPKNLNIRLLFRDASGNLLFKRTRAFAKAIPDYYQGRPDPGSRHVIAIPLPLATADASNTLFLQLRDGKNRILQDDLRAPLVLPCSALPRVNPPEPA